MCDRSSDPTEHDAARARPSALDVEALRIVRGKDPSRFHCPACKAELVDDLARLVEPDAGGGTKGLPPRCSVIWNGCRCGRAPHADDRHVWMNTLDHDRAVDPARYPTPDTTEATLRAALERAAQNNHDEGDHGMGGSGPRTFRQCADRYCSEARAALEQPAVQPEYRCGVCGSEDRVEHNDEMHAQEARAVQPKGNPE